MTAEYPVSTPTPVQDTTTELVAGETSATVDSNKDVEIVIKRGRGAAKTLNLHNLQMPLQQG